MINYNISVENEYLNWEIDKEQFLKTIRQIFEYYLNNIEVAGNCCLKDYDYNTIAFDILLTDSKMTHIINKEYRKKDYPADIITFAIFADSDENERIITDLEINLGEVIMGLDKIIEEAKKKEISKEAELIFLMSHGILHLLGFDHKTQKDFEFMVDKQKKALESIGIKYDKI